MLALFINIIKIQGKVYRIKYIIVKMRRKNKNYVLQLTLNFAGSEERGNRAKWPPALAAEGVHTTVLPLHKNGRRHQPSRLEMISSVGNEVMDNLHFAIRRIL
jgi:hypothetical protein